MLRVEDQVKLLDLKMALQRAANPAPAHSAGSFVRCRFPYPDKPGEIPKSRPVLILDISDEGAERYATVLFVSSHEKNGYYGQYRIPVFPEHTGLPPPADHDHTFLYLHKTALLPVTNYFFPEGLRPIGRLSDRLFKKVLEVRDLVPAEDRDELAIRGPQLH